MTDERNGHPRDGLSAYLDDQLGVEDRAAMDRHLANCEDCREELEALWLLAKAVGKEVAPPVPVELAGRIGRSLDAATVVRFPRRRFLVPATIAATIGAIGILVSLQWREGRFVAPPTPVPQERDRAFDEAKRTNEAPASVATDDTSKARQARPEKEAATIDSKDNDVKLTDEPAVEELSKQKKDEGVADGAAGGIAGGRAVERVAAEPPAPAPSARSAVASSCLDRWSDSGIRGSWDVPDLYEAQRQLGRIAHAVGGNGLWRGVAEGRPYVVLVPREHFEETFYALRARGVFGLDELPTLGEGTDCKGVSITLTVTP